MKINHFSSFVSLQPILVIEFVKVFDCPIDVVYHIDPSDPHKYFVCNNQTGDKYLLECLPRTYFDIGSHQCVELAMPQINCTDDGYWSDPTDKHKYFICLRETPHWMSCPNGYQFDQIDEDCLVIKLGISPAPSTSPIPTSPTPDDYTCHGKSDGTYAVDGDPGKFRYCHNKHAYYIDCCCDLEFNELIDRCWWHNKTAPHKTTDKPGYDVLDICKKYDHGDFADPTNPHGFIQCDHGHGFHSKCPSEKLVFDVQLHVCVFPNQTVPDPPVIQIDDEL